LGKGYWDKNDNMIDVTDGGSLNRSD